MDILDPLVYEVFGDVEADRRADDVGDDSARVLAPHFRTFRYGPLQVSVSGSGRGYWSSKKMYDTCFKPFYYVVIHIVGSTKKDFK